MMYLTNLNSTWHKVTLFIIVFIIIVKLIFTYICTVALLCTQGQAMYVYNTYSLNIFSLKTH